MLVAAPDACQKCDSSCGAWMYTSLQRGIAVPKFVLYNKCGVSWDEYQHVAIYDSISFLHLEEWSSLILHKPSNFRALSFGTRYTAEKIATLGAKLQVRNV